jgi:hypothetical protein
MLSLLVFATLNQIAIGTPRDISVSVPNRYSPTPAIKPLAKITPHGVIAVKTSWIRGYNPVCWSYETTHKLDAIKSALLAQGFKKEGASASLMKREPDRIQSAMVISGRWRCREEHSSKAWSFYDKDKYTTVQITESPYLVGPLPESWSALAKQPKPFAPIPSTQIHALDKAELVSMSIDETPSGHMQVWITWTIQMPESEFENLMKNDAKVKGLWRTSPKDIVPLSGRSRMYPTDKSLKWVYLDRDNITSYPSNLNGVYTFVSGSFVGGRFQKRSEEAFGK